MAETKLEKRCVRLDMTFQVSLQHNVPRDLPTSEAEEQCLELINTVVKRAARDLKIVFTPAVPSKFMDPSAPKDPKEKD